MAEALTNPCILSKINFKFYSWLNKVLSIFNALMINEDTISKMLTKCKLKKKQNKTKQRVNFSDLLWKAKPWNNLSHIGNKALVLLRRVQYNRIQSRHIRVNSVHSRHLIGTRKNKIRKCLDKSCSEMA